MIYEAKVLGATAVLLICALLPEETLKEYLETAHSLGLSALVETHDEAEVAQAMRAGARIIGVNNRNLKDFTVDIHNSERLRSLSRKTLFSYPRAASKRRRMSEDCIRIKPMPF